MGVRECKKCRFVEKIANPKHEVSKNVVTGKKHHARRRVHEVKAVRVEFISLCAYIYLLLNSLTFRPMRIK